MINFDDYVKKKKKKKLNIIQNSHKLQITYMGGSGSGKTNASLSLIENQPDIDK